MLVASKAVAVVVVTAIDVDGSARATPAVEAHGGAVQRW